MRDTDRDLTSVVVVRADSDIASVADLVGRTVAVGAVDSPQATLIPLSYLRRAGVSADVGVRRFDVGVGLHGDHIGGERDAARALAAGEVDAACMIDANHLLFVREGTLAAGSTRVLAQTAPYDHCNMTVVDGVAPEAVDRFGGLLLSMSYADPTSGRCSTWRGSPPGARDARRGTPPWRRPSTRPASTTPRAMSPPPTIDLEGLGFEEGAHLLLKRALAGLPAGARLAVRGGTRPWPSTCGRGAGLMATVSSGGDGDEAVARRRPGRRRRPALDGGGAGGRPRGPSVAATPSPRWGLAARGALVEAGGPDDGLRPRRRPGGVGRRRPQALRPGRRRPVGSGDRRRLGRAP